jgi:hypothetical protein
MSCFVKDKNVVVVEKHLGPYAQNFIFFLA